MIFIELEGGCWIREQQRPAVWTQTATHGQGLGSPDSTGRWSVGREGSQCPLAACEGSLGSTCLQKRSGDGVRDTTCPSCAKKTWVSPGRVSEHPPGTRGLPACLVTTQGLWSAPRDQGQQEQPSQTSYRAGRGSHLLRRSRHSGWAHRWQAQASPSHSYHSCWLPGPAPRWRTRIARWTEISGSSGCGCGCGLGLGHGFATSGSVCDGGAQT